MFEDCFDSVRKSCPLIFNITNYVTVNDVANAVLACGASPVMSDEEDDVEDLASISQGININIGTLNKHSINSMFLAGKKANKLNKRIVLDPVGAGATRLRTETSLKLINEIHFDVIKGNISEIKSLARGGGNTKGVDAEISDYVTDENLEQSVEFMKAFSKKTGSVIVSTGAIDLVSDSKKCFVIRNGRPEMEKITGTGCQLSGLIASFIAANQNNVLEASAAAVVLMGLSGEVAFSLLQKDDGNCTYRNRIIDAIYNMDGNKLKNGAKYEIC